MNASPQHYKVMPSPHLRDGEMTLRAVCPHDIESIRQWRNAQMDVLRQTAPISPEEQEKYFSLNIWPDKSSQQPKQILLAIEENEALIGYGGLVHISWEYRRAEISFLLKPALEKNPEALFDYFSRYLLLVQTLAFADLNLERLTTETYAHRKIHIKALESAGFQLEGRLREHVLVQGKKTDALMHGYLSREWQQRRLAISKTNVLVTSAAQKIPLIQALQSAAKRIRENIKIIAGDTDPMVASHFLSDEFWQMPRLCDDLLTALIDECHRRNISIIFPTRDGELNFWANHRQTLAHAGIEVIISSAAAIALCRDKLKFSDFGHHNHLPFIPAATTPEAFGETLLVVKERFGAGSRGIGIGLRQEEALAHAKKLDDPIFQPFISGPEISIDSWIRRDGTVMGVVLRQRNRVIAGESQITTTFRNPILEEQAIRCLKALDLQGPVVMQAICTGQTLHIIECNPRFGGASTASIAVGLDSLYWSLAEILDHSHPLMFLRSATELRQVRYPADKVFDDSNF